MGRHAAGLRIALNACVLAVASVYAGHALASQRPANLASSLPPAPPSDALASAAASISPEHRWAQPPASEPASTRAALADAPLVEGMQLRTSTGGRLQSVGPLSVDPVLKVTPAGAVLLDAGASVRYADTQRPGIRIELSAPGREALGIGRVDGSGALINPYAALVRVAKPANATMAVVENGRVFLRRTESTALARSEATGVGGEESKDEVALKTSPAISLARAEPLSAPSDAPTLAASAAEAALDLKIDLEIDGLQIASQLPDQDAPPAQRPPEVALVPAREGALVSPRELELVLRADALVLSEVALVPSEVAHAPDLSDISEAGFASDGDVATIELAPSAASGAGYASLETGALQIYAQDTTPVQAGAHAALVVLPRADPAPRARLVIDLFDPPDEPADPPSALLDARAVGVYGALTYGGRAAALQ